MADSLTSITGLSSGFDYRALVDQIIKLDRRPADRMQAAVDANAKRKEALAQYRTALEALQTAAEGLKTGTAFDKWGVTALGTDASGRDLLAATAGAGAAAGTYQVGVTQLARAQKTTAGAGFAPAAATGVAGTLRITRPSGATFDVALAAGDTLAGVRDKINARNTGTAPSGVQASLINVSATEQRLVLTAANPGAAGGFALSEVDGGGLLDALGLDPASATAARQPLTQAAQNARLTIDGIELERATNTVADAVPGVTLNLASTDPARTATVTVARDAKAGGDAIKTYVEAFNAARAVSAKLGATGGPLAGDSLLRTARASLSSQTLAADATLPAGLQTLAAAGLTLQRDGTLAFDQARYDAAAARPDDLRALLASRMGAVADQVKVFAQPLTGMAAARSSAIEIQSARLESRIADVDARLDKKKTALLAQYARFEAALGQIKSAGDSLTAQLKGLTSSDD